MNSVGKLSLLSLGIALLALLLSFHTGQRQGSHKETAYEHVLRTRTIRCAYMLWPELIDRDPNTGRFSGYSYDMMTALAATMGLSVTWGPEIAVGTQVETLVAGKADAVCDDGPLQLPPTLQLAYTEPYAFFPFYAFVRADDVRFAANDNARVNAPDVKVSMIDGDVSHEILRTLYTRSVPVPLPQLADPSLMMMDVVAKKADAVLIDDMSIGPFMKSSPGKLRKVSDKAIVVVPASFSVLRTETALADMISQATLNLRDRGIEAQINAKYGIGKTISVYPATKRYEGR